MINHNPSIPTAGRSHIGILDGIRGLAVVMVMMFHFTRGWTDAPPLVRLAADIARAGWIGVDLFFVLSGFLITGILYDAKGRCGYFKIFYMRRILRIFPLYFAVLIGLWLLTRSGSPPTGVAEYAQRQSWLWMHCSNIAVAIHNQWMFTTEWFSLNHFWSLAVEEHFYLFWPVVIGFLSRRRAMQFCVACILLAFATRCGLLWTVGSVKAIYVLTPCRMDVLAIGAWVALAVRSPGGLEKLLPAAKAVTVVIGIVLLGAYAHHELYKYHPFMETVGYTCLGLFFAAVLVRAVAGDLPAIVLRFLNGRTLAYLGRRSYALYIFHCLLLVSLRRYFHWQPLGDAMGSVVLGYAVHLVVVTGVTIAVSHLSWHMIEKHFLALKRHFAYDEHKPDRVIPSSAHHETASRDTTAVAPGAAR